jgi:hypothetical protein
VKLIGWVFIPFLVIGAAPNWWSQRGVLNPNASPDDYALANQGQLKNIATAAVAEFDEHLPGGAGDTLHSLVNGWNQPNAQRNDFAPVNLGQLKNAVRSFYDRLIAIGYADTYPWTGAPNPPDDFAIANIGQVKNLFSFDLLATDIVHDSDQNGLPDWWEKYYFGNTGVDPNGDVDGDGRSNFEEFLHGTDPNDYYNGVVSELTIVGGDDQLGDPSSVLSLPLVVRATRGGQPLVNAPIEFRVPADSGLFLIRSSFGQVPAGQRPPTSGCRRLLRWQFRSLSRRGKLLPPCPLTRTLATKRTGQLCRSSAEIIRSGCRANICKIRLW